jgi:hypothetical protein
MTATKTRDFAALGITLQIAGETLCEILAVLLYGAADLPTATSLIVRSAVYITCLAVLPRLRRRISYNHTPGE